MRSHRRQACFSRTVRITRKALRISSSCSAASSPGNSANHRTPGNTAQSAAAASHPVGVTQGTVCGCGSDAAGAALPGHPPGRSAYRFPAAAGSGQLPFARYGGIPFRNDCRSSSGAAYPVAPADGLFRVPGCSAFPAGRGSTLPVRPALFQQKDVVRRGVVHKPVFYRAYSATTGIKSATTWSGDVSNRFGCRQSIPSISIASCAGVRNTLPSRAEGGRSDHVLVALSAGTDHRRWTRAVLPDCRCVPGR